LDRLYVAVMLIILFLLVLSVTKVRMRLKYLRQGKDDEFSMDLSLWQGKLHYKFEVPLVEMGKKDSGRKTSTGPGRFLHSLLRPVFKIKTEIEGKGGRPIAEDKKRVRVPGPARMINLAKDMIQQYQKYKTAVFYLFNRVHLQHFQWKTEIGLSDPAQTGFLTGTAWAIKGIILSLVYRLFLTGETKPVVAVSANYEKACLNTFFDCIFEVRIGYIIFTGMKALFLRFK